jgi:hypothetical protein
LSVAISGALIAANDLTEVTSSNDDSPFKANNPGFMHNKHDEMSLKAENVSFSC